MRHVSEGRAPALKGEYQAFYAYVLWEASGAKLFCLFNLTLSVLLFGRNDWIPVPRWS
jgi:hypothetical protein